MAKREHNFHKNQRLEVEIESIAPGGQGFTKKPGIPIFVNRGVPGDHVELELYDLRKDFAHGRITKLLQPSPLRTEPPCKLFKICGGCQWQHIAYEHQLELKSEIVRQAVRHIGRLDPDLVLKTLPGADPLYYRNKVQFPIVQQQNSTRILAGYYQEGSHELVNIKHCPVQPEPLDRLLEAVKSLLEKYGFSAYDESDHTGLFRHIAARFSFAFNQILLTLVLNAQLEQIEELRPQLTLLAEDLMAAIPELIGVSLNSNPDRGNRIMGNETFNLLGQSHITEKLVTSRSWAPELLQNGLSFRLSPNSFFQVNSAQAVQLLDLVMDAVVEWQKSQPDPFARVPLIIDAYAGVGTIAFWLSDFAEKVLAIEEVPDAIDDGNEIASLNGIENVEFRSGSVEQVFPQIFQENLRPQIVILDPPRKGVARDVLEQVAALGPERIIYVSCNPSTLARDLEILKRFNYVCRQIQPLDMFPQTHHIESVTVLEKNKIE